MKDQEFLDEADKLKIEIVSRGGEQVAALIEQIYKTPAATVERVRDAMAPEVGSAQRLFTHTQNALPSSSAKADIQ